MVSPMMMASDLECVSHRQSASAIDSLMRVAALLMLCAIAAVFVWRLVRWQQRFWPGARDSSGDGRAAITDLPDRIDLVGIEDQYSDDRLNLEKD